MTVALGSLQVDENFAVDTKKRILIVRALDMPLTTDSSVLTLVDSQVGSAGASVTAILPAQGAGLTTYIEGFDMTADPVALAISANVQVAPIGVNAMILRWRASYTVIGGELLSIRFRSPLPAAAPNTAIQVTAIGFVGTPAATINAFGFAY
jgi:hypothetical protein